VTTKKTVSMNEKIFSAMGKMFSVPSINGFIGQNSLVGNRKSALFPTSGI